MKKRHQVRLRYRRMGVEQHPEAVPFNQALRRFAYGVFHFPYSSCLRKETQNVPRVFWEVYPVSLLE